jgi:dTDP-4-amino-4,6-dideoxygalactose transaminase
MYVDPAHTELTPGELCAALEGENIEARPVWRPMHTQPIFEGAQRVGGAVAERLYASGVCLPSSSSLTPDRQAFVVQSLCAALAAEPARTR